MSGFNRCVLMGNVVQDIGLRHTPSGTAVTDMRLAVDDIRGKTEETVFIDVTLWGRTAEVANEYLQKGDPVLIEGRLQLDRWETVEGAKRSKIKVVADRMKLIGGRKERNNETSNNENGGNEGNNSPENGSVHF